MLLTVVRDQLRTALSRGPYECDIQPGGHPPAMARDSWVCVDDGGVAFAQPQDENWLLERYNVIVSVLVRVGVKPKDMTGDLMQREPDVYSSLDGLERKIKQKLHGKQEIRVAYNAVGGFGEGTQEAAVMPLTLRSQGRTYEYVSPLDQPPDMRGWLRRDITFTGMDRQFLPENVG